ncbi:MAG: hypothetical protein LBL18_00775, partial [Bacteroidales bacterium]|nr:hypothetical protein [Bacteroidales bacterium]
MKRLLFVIAVLLAIQGTAQTVWNGTADQSWYDDSQSSFNISTPEQLAGLAQLVNGGNAMQGKTIYLTADIWLNAEGSQTNQWTPIGQSNHSEGGCPSGTGSNRFSGTFNGNSYSVYNMYINNSSTTGNGFFGGLNGATITLFNL